MFHAFCPFLTEFWLKKKTKKKQCVHKASDLDFDIAVRISTRPEQILTKTKVTTVKVIQKYRNVYVKYVLTKIRPFCRMLLRVVVVCIATPCTQWNNLVDLFCWITLICSGPTCVPFVQPLYVCLYHITQFFPQQVRLRGPAKPRMPTTAPPFLCLHEENCNWEVA